MEADPDLGDLKLISEPWDCGGLYRLADFPARRVATWNGRFRDDLRRFWKGDEKTCWTMAQRLSGSPDLFTNTPVHPGQCITFLTAHDGFTLTDLVSFNGKHNLANGEDNRDGDNHNNTWNHGVEGPSSDPAITALRERQLRNLLTSLLLAPGVPMLLMGDEVRRSQGGNNNTWCQDNPSAGCTGNPIRATWPCACFCNACCNYAPIWPGCSTPSCPLMTNPSGAAAIGATSGASGTGSN